MRLPPAERGRCCAPALQAPPARAPGAPTRALEGTASPAHLSPRLTCCFSGAEANPSGRQRGKRIAVSVDQQLLSASPVTPGGANVEWEGPLISSLTYNPSLCPEGRALWGRRYQSDISPNPRDQHRALYRTPELTSQCAFVQMKQEPI